MTLPASRSASVLDNEALLHAQLELSATSPRQVALCRIQSLLPDDSDNNDGVGLALPLASLLREVVRDVELVCWTPSRLHRSPPIGDTPTTPPSSTLLEAPQIRKLLRLLGLCYQLSSTDPCLDQELARQGSHEILTRILKWDADSLPGIPTTDVTPDHNTTSSNDEWTDRDVIIELQDVAGAWASLSGSSFPQVMSPFTVAEMKQRLPILFHVEPPPEELHVENDRWKDINGNAVMIHQVTSRQSAQSDVGFVLWPSSVILARYLVLNPHLVLESQCNLELGAGCGLVGLVAAMLLQRHAQKAIAQSPTMNADSRPVNDNSTATPSPSPSRVYLTDFNRTVLHNLKRNVSLNELEQYCQVFGLDFDDQVLGAGGCGWKDLAGIVHQEPLVDLILAADVICQPDDAYNVSQVIHKALRRGGQALVVCATSRHRFGVDHLVPACHERGLQVQVYPVEDLLEGELLRVSLPDLHQTCGFIEDMQMTLSRIVKPS